MTGLQQYAIDSDQVRTRDVATPEPGFDFLALNSMLYKLNRVTGEAWRLDKGKHWVLIDEAPSR